MARRPGIYSILNSVDGSQYIGSSVDVVRRLWVHRHLLRQGKHHSPRLQRAYARDGEAAFSFAPIELFAEVDGDLLLRREQLWINYAGSAVDGYNVCAVTGTRAGVKQPASVSIKMRAFHTGKPKTAEQRAKMSAAAKGRKKSPEHKQRLREAAQRQFDNLAARAAAAEYAKLAASPKGRVASPEAIENMRAAAKRRMADPAYAAKVLGRLPGMSAGRRKDN